MPKLGYGLTGLTQMAPNEFFVIFAYTHFPYVNEPSPFEAPPRMKPVEKGNAVAKT